MSSRQGRGQAFWKVVATPGHTAEQLLAPSLGVCIVGDVAVSVSGMGPKGSVLKAGVFSGVAR